MGWIGDLINVIRGAETLDFILTDPLPLAQKDGKVIAPQPSSLLPDDCYIELFVESMWLPKARRLTSLYHGVVHAYTALERVGEGKAEFAFISTPTELAKVDPRSQGKVVTRSMRALGPVPWRGGDFHVEIGIFSVKSGDLADPVLDFVASMAGSAGVSFVSPAAPFVPYVRKGLQLLTGASGDNVLEVGLDKTFQTPIQGFFALIAADRPDIVVSDLSIASDDHRLLYQGETLRAHPWLVFRIGSTKEKVDFASVPELKAAWTTFQSAVRSRKRSEAEEALNNFRFVVLSCPDLITSDAERLLQKATDIMFRCFQQIMMNKQVASDLLPPDLCDVGLYD